MRRYLLTFLSLVLFLGQSLCLSAQTQTKESKLLMTIGCVSDLHCEFGLLTAGDANTVKLRRTFPKTMQLMKEQENLDVILVGGDVTGLSSATQSNWERSRELFVNGISSAFNTGYDPHVLVAAGNHEYQAGGAGESFGFNFKYNSADYYSTPMKGWNGELASSECFYETSTKAPSVPLLAAYHYEIKGVDFVVLNTAKYLLENKDDYSYSKESAQWCVDKIDELYAKNPEGTVFFVMHIPFGDSNSISSSSKGISSKDGSSDILKKGLAKHPNTIVLYGHDHGGDKAYTTEKTSQRLTRYDTSGNKMSSITDVNHVDGTEQPEISEPGVTYRTVTRTFSCLQNVANGKYLGRDAKGINLLTTPQELKVSSIGNNLFRTLFTYDGTQYNLSCGGSGYFSANKNVTSTSEQENAYWYRVDDINASTVTGTRVTSLQSGKNYILVQYYKVSKDSKYFALGNTLTNSSSQSIASYALGKKLSASITIKNTNKAAQAYIYTYKEETVTEQIEEPTTPSVTPEPDNASFVSLFMGSMRYYNNKIEGGYVSGYNGNDTVAAKVIQALIVYVYEDRIEMRMKNYGESGTFGTVKVNKDLTPYTIFRKVVLNKVEEDDPVDPTPDDPVDPTPDDPVVPAPQIYAQTTVGGEWNLVKAIDGALTIDGTNWYGYKADTDYEFDVLNYSKLYPATTWQSWYVPFDLTLTKDILERFSFAEIQTAIVDATGALSLVYAKLNEGDIVKANTPYVVKAISAYTDTPQVITIANATLKKPVEYSFTTTTARDEYAFYGVYNTKVSSASDTWYALNADGIYQKMAAGDNLKPFDIYMTITPREDSPYSFRQQPSEVKLIVFGDEEFNEDANAINEIILKAQKTDKWYNLQGIEVQTPTKGIYIKNGKKYLF